MADDNHPMALLVPAQQHEHLLSQQQEPLLPGNEGGSEGQADSHKRTYQACVGNQLLCCILFTVGLYPRV